LRNFIIILGPGTRSHLENVELSRRKTDLLFPCPSIAARAPHLGRLANIANFLVQDTYVFGFVGFVSASPLRAKSPLTYIVSFSFLVMLS
jgi:hypothetical protein